MNYNFSIKKNKTILLGFMLLMFCCLFCFLISVAYKKALTTMTFAAENSRSILIDNFNKNENIAEAISVWYLRYNLKHRAYCSSILNLSEYWREGNIYGMNLFTVNTKMVKGALQSLQPINSEACSISRVIDDVFDVLPEQEKFVHYRHYFFSFEKYWVYLINFLSVNEYLLKNDRAMNLEIFNGPPDYITRKFTSDTTRKGETSTDLYPDPMHHQVAYSIISYVYDLTDLSSAKILGALMYDYNVSDLQDIVRSAYPDIDARYTSVKIYSHDTGESISVFGGDDYAFPVELILSKKYSLIFSLDLMRFVVYGKHSVAIFFSALIMSVFSTFLLLRCIIRHDVEIFTDHLTKLYNRKILNYLPPARYNKKLTIALLDCNKFKYINDNYGHEVGDRALAYLSKAIAEEGHKRAAIGIRLGGDEFCMVFKDRSFEEVTSCIERINELASGFSEDVSLSVSYGIVEMVNDELVYHAINRADMALYQNKKQRHESI